VCLLIGAFACGDASTNDGKLDASPDVDLSTCGAVGMPCGNDCSGDLECLSNQSACAPVRGQCGGFAGAECQADGVVCTYPTGDSGGICMTPAEKACVCALAPGALSDC
jgi:hypothetical protein